MDSRPRFTLAGLLGVIAICGVGFAALRTPTPLWANLLETLALIALMAAAVNAAFARGGRRRSWVGFGACCGLYFAACFPYNLNDDRPQRLATAPLLEWLYERTFARDASMIIDGATPPVVILSGSSAPLPTTDLGQWTAVNPSDGVGWTPGRRFLKSTHSFRRIGHALFALLFGLAGGLLTRWAFPDKSPGPNRPVSQ